MQPGGTPPNQVQLRAVTLADVPIVFEQQRDPEARRIAVFTSQSATDLEAFTAHWTRILADDTPIKRTVLVDGLVAGDVVSFTWDGKREVGYWIAKQFWGRGVATAALTQFLRIVTARPLYAAAAADNAGSIRVLQKCGFAITGRAQNFANARGEEIEEVLFELE